MSPRASGGRAIWCMESYHALRECNFFQSLSVGERTRRVRSLKLCEGCLTFGHSTHARNCPFRRGDDGLCPVRKCGRGHHRLLHDDGVVGEYRFPGRRARRRSVLQQWNVGQKPRAADDAVGQGRRGRILPCILGPGVTGQSCDHPVCTRKKASSDGKELPEAQWPGFGTRTESNISLQGDVDAHRRPDSGIGGARSGDHSIESRCD